jgi:hypothetical protein
MNACLNVRSNGVALDSNLVRQLIVRARPASAYPLNNVFRHRSRRPLTQTAMATFQARSISGIIRFFTALRKRVANFRAQRRTKDTIESTRRHDWNRDLTQLRLSISSVAHLRVEGGIHVGEIGIWRRGARR